MSNHICVSENSPIGSLFIFVSKIITILPDPFRNVRRGQVQFGSKQKMDFGEIGRKKNLYFEVHILVFFFFLKNRELNAVVRSSCRFSFLRIHQNIKCTEPN